MFICCKKKLELLESNNFEDCELDSVYCLCEICNKRELIDIICKDCCISLDKSDFKKCENIFYHPIVYALNNRDIIRNARLLVKNYDLYKYFSKYIFEYIILYKNFYKIFIKIYNLNNYDIKKTKKCFRPFFSFGILYFVNNEKKFICKNCMYK